MNFLNPAEKTVEREQQLIKVALVNWPVPKMTYTGECHFCEEAISKGSFCSKECGEDYQKVERAKQFKGVP
jgi:hypothetical protein